MNGKTLTFGHEGILYKNSFIMYDKQSRSLWVHVTGQAIRGPMKGSQLEFLPSVVTTWATWKAKHSDTTVLTGKRARGFMGAFKLAEKLPNYGLSVGQGGTVKLYPFTILARRRVINDEFNGKNIVVVFDVKSATGTAFERGDRTFSWKDGAMRDQAGAEWDLIRGASRGGALTPVPATAWLINRWRPFYPKSPVYR